MSRAEMTTRGWAELDILLISGDAYVDHPSFGVAVIGRVLEADGWRVGVIAQPDWRDPASVALLGRPRIFCGITAGNLDSMLANYTVGRRKRREDAYSEGGVPGRRPSHATVVYGQLARRAFPGLPIVLGGVEASLRRVTHYDYWQDCLRPSVLVDSRADLLAYGMAETAIREVARRLAGGTSDLTGIRGTAFLLGANAARGFDPAGAVFLPGTEVCERDRSALLRLTKTVEQEQNPHCGRRLLQRVGDRLLVVEPPALPLPSAELDRVHELPYTHAPHPIYRRPIPAHTVTKDSLIVVRGCPGGCSFCGLGLHQGRFVQSRSQESVVRETQSLLRSGTCRGTITDLGGPTANVYGCCNGLQPACASCRKPSCLYPSICPRFEIREQPVLDLLDQVSQLPGVRHVFVSSGVRMDVALQTPRYLERLVQRHVSGHLKVAPEHLAPSVLRRMRKPPSVLFHRFREAFMRESHSAGKEQYLVPYFISSFPGCTQPDMQIVEDALQREGWRLQQVQDFIPLPMTPAAAMYYSGLDYETETPIPVVRGLQPRRRQKQSLTQVPHAPRRTEGTRSSRHRQRTR